MSEPVPVPAKETDRAMLAALDRIERRLTRLESAIDRLEILETSIPNAVAAATDTFDDAAEKLRARGVDLDERVRIVLDVAERLTSPEALRALTTLLDKVDLIQHLLDSGVFAEDSVDVVGRAGLALTTARAEQTREVGLFGAMRAMSDEDIKRALGFVLRVAQLFGSSLREPTSVARLTDGGGRT